MPKIMLFLGAGASAPFGYPTTREFIDGFKKVLSGTEEEKLLNVMLQNKEVQDIEKVIQIADAAKVIGEYPLVELFKVMSVSLSGWNFQPFLSFAKNLLEKAKNQVFETYRRKPNLYDTARNVHLPLLEEMRRINGNNEVIVATTNYDRVLEEFCHNHPGYDYIDGFVYNAKKKISEWKPSELERSFESQDSVGIKLLKLHGSLDWRKRDGSIIKVATEEKSVSGDDNILIYPGEKREPRDNPFLTIYHHFSSNLMNIDTCITIGFSFRDDYINKIFLDFLENKRHSLICVSPSASNNLPDNLLGDREVTGTVHALDMKYGETVTLEKIIGTI